MLITYLKHQVTSLRKTTDAKTFQIVHIPCVFQISTQHLGYSKDEKFLTFF